MSEVTQKGAVHAIDRGFFFGHAVTKKDRGTTEGIMRSLKLALSKMGK